MSYLILVAILIPLVGAAVVYFASKLLEEIGGVVATLFSGLALFVVGWMYMLYNQGTVFRLNFEVGLPFKLSFAADSLGLFLSLITCFVWTLASLYAIEYIQERKVLFNVFLLLSLYGMLGIALTGNLFSLLLFFEVFSVASAVLVVHEGTPEALRAGFQYLFMSIVGSVAIILATAVVWRLTGSISLMGHGLAALGDSPLRILLFWLLVMGFAVKAGMFPVHVWLPEAHPIAPSPASALLSGVMIKAGAYGIIRVVFGVFGAPVVNAEFMSKTLLVLAVITMILGSILAITQTELKRLLAYSSVAQIGYVILGIALLTPRGLQGGVLHIFNHALMKGSLFLAAGAIIHQTGLRNLDDLRGIGKRLPLTMTAFTLAALSMIGVPPFIGFFSKWLLALGALQAKDMSLIGTWPAYGIVGALVLSSLLNIVYYGPIIMRGWFSDPVGLPEAAGQAAALADGGGHGHGGHDDDEEGHAVPNMDPSWLMIVPMLLLSVLTLVLGLYVNIPMRLVTAVKNLYF